MRHPIAWLLALLLSACAAPTTTFVAPTAVGKPGAEVSKLVAASEAKPREGARATVSPAI